MHICFASDNHLQHVELPAADLLVHSGDASETGSVKELLKEAEWLREQKKKFPLGVVFVPGNHDEAFDLSFIQEKTALWLKDPYHAYKPKISEKDHLAVSKAFLEAGIKVLLHEETTIEGIRIFGSPFVPVDQSIIKYPFARPAWELKEDYKEIPLGVNLLITHGPPQGILDEAYFGSSALRDRINMLKDLRIHAFGHIHAGAGYAQRHGKLFVNACLLGQKTGRLNPVMVADLNTLEVKLFEVAPI